MIPPLDSAHFLLAFVAVCSLVALRLTWLRADRAERRLARIAELEAREEESLDAVLRSLARERHPVGKLRRHLAAVVSS